MEVAVLWERDVRHERHLGSEVHPPLPYPLVEPAEAHGGIWAWRSGIGADLRLAAGQFEAYRGVNGRVAHVADGFIGKEELFDLLLLEGLEPGEVGLIVRKYAAHQLGVRAVFVGQVAVPGQAEIAAAPDPLLFAGDKVMIGDVEDAGLLVMVVAADEIVSGPCGHEGCGDGQVLVPGDVHAARVIDLVILTAGDGESGDIALAMVIHRLHVGRKDRLIVIVYVNGRVGPEMEALRERRGIEEADIDFEQ